MQQLDPVEIKARIGLIHISRGEGAFCGILRTPPETWPVAVRHVDGVALRKRRTDFKRGDLCSHCIAVFEQQVGSIAE